jgi:hypothetical protein
LDTGEPRQRRQDYRDRFFAKYRELLNCTATVPVAGNHDVRADGGATWARLFRSNGAVPLAMGPRYYSFTWGTTTIGFDGGVSRPLLLVLVLDTSTAAALAARGPQTTWLAAQLAAARVSRPVWMVAVAHYPPFGPTGSEAPGVALRTVALPQLVAAGVHVLVTAHAHTYLRGRAATGGMVHVVVGTGGAPLRAAPVPVTPPYTTGNTVYSTLVLDVTATKLTGTQVSTSGAALDAFVLSATP